MIDINGKLFEGEELQFSPLDSAVYYGFSVYETMFIKNSSVGFFNEHMDRLDFSSKFFKFPLMNRVILTERIKKYITTNQIINGRLRLIYTPGNYKSINKINEMNSILSHEKIDEIKSSINLCTTLVKKPNPFYLPPQVKISSNLFSLMSYREAKEKGYDEGIMFSGNDIVSEGSYCNLFWVKNNKIYTPDLNSSILDGVTRNKILLSAKKNGINIYEGVYYKSDLFSSDSLFISSSTRGLLSVSRLDEKIFHETDIKEINLIKNEYESLLDESLKAW